MNSKRIPRSIQNSPQYEFGTVITPKDIKGERGANRLAKV